jgi:GT2 family glycosyltransferase
VPSDNPECRILAITTLYQEGPTDSRALTSFFRLLEKHRNIADCFSLVVYDNSPQPHRIENQLAHHYLHDPDNGGLAAAYNYALNYAEKNGYAWLLLLDQDTLLTEEFLNELLTTVETVARKKDVAVIVPKLEVRGEILSPSEHFVQFLRHQFRNRVTVVARESIGIQQGSLTAYNSGSTMRVTALRAIGGFPSAFWLDYLDHAVFHALSVAGYHLYVLRSVLQHELAESDLNARPLWRFRSVLKSQALFLRNAGSLRDRLLYRLWLLRSVRRLRADCRDPRIWKETAMQALSMGAFHSTIPTRPPSDPLNCKETTPC